MSFETGKPTYAQHHSEDKFVRRKPEKYLECGHLESTIKTITYLVDRQTGRIIDTFCADEVQSYQQKPSPVEHDQLISVKRIDYELAFYSSTTRKCLWYLRFARFDAWYETACNWTLRMRENMPYVKQYIKVYQARYRGSLIIIFEANDINISSETQRLLNKDEDDIKAIQGTSKKKKKKKARKAKKDSTTADTDEKMIIESNETNNEHINQSQADNLLVSKTEVGKGRNDTIVFEGKYHGLDVAVKRYNEKSAYNEVHNLSNPALNSKLVKLLLVKYEPNITYLVFERCICSLHDVIFIIKNKPDQVQQLTTEDLETIKSWNTSDVLERTRLVKAHYNICLFPQRQIRGIPGDLSLGIGFPGDLSPGICRAEK
ncbi:serine/threonine-protein kinase/endoribonuclease IRE1b-like protein, partial [Tanacetum coccineum]